MRLLAFSKYDIHTFFHAVPIKTFIHVTIFIGIINSIKSMRWQVWLCRQQWRWCWRLWWYEPDGVEEEASCHPPRPWATQLYSASFCSFLHTFCWWRASLGDGAGITVGSCSGGGGGRRWGFLGAVLRIQTLLIRVHILPFTLIWILLFNLIRIRNRPFYTDLDPCRFK